MSKSSAIAVKCSPVESPTLLKSVCNNIKAIHRTHY